MVTKWRQGEALPTLPSSVAVTGALGGIGIPTTDLLIEMGADVTAIDVVPEDVAVARLPDVAYKRCDIADHEQVNALVASWTDDELPRSLVGLAGIVIPGPLIDQTPEDIRRVLDVNVLGQIILTQALIRRWVSVGVPGIVVLVSSWVQDVPWPGIGPYSASKAALRAIARAIAREHARDGIRCNVIAPGIVGVGMARRQWDSEPDYRARAQRAIPLGTLQTPESVAQGIAFLLSSWSSYMTGSVLLVDGGASLYPMDEEELGGNRD